MFVVYNGGKPADAKNHKVHESWSNNRFDTFEEALTYADKWLGIYSPGLENLKGSLPYNYAGYDDTVIDIIKED